jgi:DNA polymerase-1
MQGSNADIIKVAMIRIHDRLRAEGRAARLVLQVHDELLLEVPDAEVAAVKELVRQEMVGAYDLDPPLAVDVGVGENWAEAKS